MRKVLTGARLLCAGLILLAAGKVGVDQYRHYQAKQAFKVSVAQGLGAITGAVKVFWLFEGRRPIPQPSTITVDINRQNKGDRILVRADGEPLEEFLEHLRIKRELAERK